MSDMLQINRDSTLSDISTSLSESVWLQRKSLKIVESNLDINRKKFLATERNAFLLQEIKETLQFGSTQIGHLTLQLEKFSNLVNQKILSEECENFARDVIFNLKKFDESLSKKSDKKFIALEAQEALTQIENFKIETQSFTQIQDKEYFSNVIESLQSKYNAISEDEKKEIDLFLELYFSVQVGMKKFKEIEKVKLANFPEMIAEKEKPNWDGILLIEGELLQELRNPYRTLDLRGPQLKNWISKIEEMPGLLEKFSEEKKNTNSKNLNLILFKKFKNGKKNINHIMSF